MTVIEESKWNKGALLGLYMLAFFTAVSISITQICLGIVLVCWLTLMIREKRIIFTATDMGRPFLFYLIAMVIAAAFGTNVGHSFGAIRHLWIILIFFALVTFVKDKKQVRTIVYCLIAGACLAAIYGILQRLMGGLDLFRPDAEKIIQYAHMQQPKEVIAIGFFHHHLTFAEVLQFSLCISLAIVMGRITNALQIPAEERSYKGIVFMLFIFGLITLGMFYSFARGSWLGFAAAFFTIMLFQRGKPALVVTAIFVISGLSIFFFHAPTQGRVLSAFKQIDRLYIWRIGTDIIKDHPITGIGPANWKSVVPPYYNYYVDNNIHHFSDEAYKHHAHNNILTITAEAGFIGLAAFLYFWIYLFIRVFRIWRKIPDRDIWEKSVAVGGLGSMVAFQVAGIFELTYGDSEVAMTLWVVTGVLFVLGALAGEKGEEEETAISK